MHVPKQRPSLGRWTTDTVFYLLLLGFQLPTAALQWLYSWLMRSSDTFRAYIRDLVRWRR